MYILMPLNEKRHNPEFGTLKKFLSENLPQYYTGHRL